MVHTWIAQQSCRPFIRIVDTGSFSPVTQHLNGAEPAASIAQLEERLDV